MKDFNLKTIQDVIRYWRHDCIEQLPGHTKQQIGAWIAGASMYATSDFDKWYKEDEDFMNLYEDALDLEMEPDYQVFNIASYWESIEEELQKLEKRYL
jgi:hypothetical protein